MKAKRFSSVFLTAALVFRVGVAFADDSVSFVIAPPPVGYPEIVPGKTVTRTGGDALFLKIDADLGSLAGSSGSDSLYALGASWYLNQQRNLSRFFAANLDAGASFLAGSEYGFMSVGIPLDMKLLFMPISGSRGSALLFAGGGGNLGAYFMTMQIPQVVGTTLVYDDVLVSTTQVTGRFTGGAQINLNLDPFIVSPFAVFTLSGGQYETSMESSLSFQYPSSGGRVDNSLSQVYGFDVLHKPSGASLSSQFRRGSDYFLISMAIRFLLKGLD